MSDTKSTSTTVVSTKPDAEMLKNLDLLLNYDVVGSDDSDVQFLEDFGDMQEAPSDDEQGDKK